ncbi:MAG: S8 family serine peptidase [Planctomycetota bacterium]
MVSSSMRALVAALSFTPIAAAAQGPVLADAGRFADLADRPPIAKPAEITRPGFESRLVVKFRDELGVRARNGALVALRPIRGARAIERAAPITWRPLIDTDEARLAEIETRAADRTGVRPIDLRSMVTIDAPEAELEAIARRLLALDEVEWVDFEPTVVIEPPCVDAAPATANYIPFQTYAGPNPGINMNAAWAAGNARGAGVQFADIEYNARFDHEDLCGIIPEAGVTFPAFSFGDLYIEHGTSVLGILNGVDNTYGVTGLVPDAQGYFFPEWTTGPRRATAITNAAATLNAGDFLVLEMQTFGPSGVSGEWAPAEYELSVWTATRAATDAGLIVFAAAGNGNQNLDAPEYAAYRARGDSGAIMVGAGANNASHSKLSFSNFGERLDVQGWGVGVAATGYGSLAQFGGDPNQRYTSSFSGTSSATPVAAGAGISLQSYAKAAYGQTLDADTLRQILIDTGIPQGGSGGQIGPLPNVMAARAAVDDLLATACFADVTVESACTPGAGDGVVTLSDFSCYLSEWSIGSAFADITTTGLCTPGAGGDGVDLSDFSCYLSEWSVGCP